MSDIKQVIVMRKDLNMRKGKMIAQGAHASMAFITNKLMNRFDAYDDPQFSDVELEWMSGNFKKICVGVDSYEEFLRIAWAATEAGIYVETILDEGLTEFDGPTYTCLAIGPDYSDKIDAITGDLKLL